MFDFLKRKSQDEIPDVGKEEAALVEPEAEESSGEADIPTEENGAEIEEEAEVEQEEKPKQKSRREEISKSIESLKKKIDNSEGDSGLNSYSEMEGSLANFEETNKFEFEKMHGRLDSINEIIKGYSERTARLSEQIGEVRSMALANEKAIAKIAAESEKVVDIVKEVKPDKLRLENQKLTMKITAIDEKIEAKTQMQETILNEVRDLRNKAGIFVGTDALLKLNEEVKKDLIELQKTSERVKANADKSEEIFIELKKNFAESAKVGDTVVTLDANFSAMQKELQKLKVDYSNIATLNDIEGAKKTFNTRLTAIEGTAAQMSQITSENERLARLIETVAAIAKKNKEDISNIAITVGEDKVERIGDYENQLTSMLSIMDSIAEEVKKIKAKIGMQGEIKAVPSNPIKNEEIRMKNVSVHKNISRSLKPRKKEIHRHLREARKIDKKAHRKIDKLLKKKKKR